MAIICYIPNDNDVSDSEASVSMKCLHHRWLVTLEQH